MLTLFEKLHLGWGLRQSHVRFLLDIGGDVQTVAKNGDTLLHLVAAPTLEEEALELAKYLVHAGCSPRAFNLLQETPLHVAVQRGYISVIKYFLSLDIALPRDILLVASTKPRHRVQVIRYLVQEGASVSITTTDKDTPLHLLVAEGDEEEDDRLECVEILIGAGCDPCAENLAGHTPLHGAARGGFNKILEYLLSHGAPLPHDILLFASTTKTLQFLLGKGLHLSGVAADDVAKLMHRALDSSGCNNSDLVELAGILISAGWDPSLKNSNGETVIQVAAKKFNIGAIKFFLSQNVPLPSDVLLTAVAALAAWKPLDPDAWFLNIGEYLEHAIALIRFLVREGASVSATASNGDTPLHLVMSRFNFRKKHNRDIQLLYQWKLVEIFLNCGSDPSARNMDGQTPFDLAEAMGHYFNMNFLRLVPNSRTHCLYP